MNKYRILTGILAGSLLFTACTGGSSQESSLSLNTTASSQENTFSLESLPEADSNSLTEQTDPSIYLEDYDYFWSELKANCPAYIVSSRSRDLEALRIKYRESLKKHPSERQLEIVLTEVIRLGFPDMLGHVNIKTEPIVPYWKQFEDSSVSTDNAETEASSLLKEFLPQMEIVPEGMIITIPTFVTSYMQEGVPMLQQWAKQAEKQGIQNIILDISSNGGGNDRFWIAGIVFPNIDTALSAEWYGFFCDTEKVRDYYALMVNGKQLVPKQKEIVDRFPEKVRRDIDQLPLQSKIPFTLNPGDSEKLYTGKFWLVVDKPVYSSASSFAVFCHDTGFATLVGRQTNGNGIGIAPYEDNLPNTGWWFRYVMLYGVNGEGHSELQEGIMPDILSPEGETPLETCLRVIREQ